MPPSRRSRAGVIERLTEFVRDYTDGLRGDDVRRLFDRDAARAYAVLSRDQTGPEEPRGRVRRWLHRARVVFLGLSYKLTPPRRLLFAAALVATLLGLVGQRVVLRGGDSVEVSADFSALWLLLAIGALVYLLAVELADRVLVRDELEVARGVQRQLLPAGQVEIPGWRVAHGYRTANEVGGDYYDFLPLTDGRLVLVAGDASGHGMAAGLVMALASAAIRTAIELDPTPVAAAGAVNRVVARTGGTRAFMSLFYGLLDPRSGELEFLSAGHPFPLVRRAGGELCELGRGGLPLGVRPHLELTSERFTLAPGDLLVIYSDGLPEGLGENGQAFGFDAVRDLVARGGEAAALHARIEAAFDAHCGRVALGDDLSLVVVERLPVAAA